MTINYGKRAPGGLTASNPGDTLYIPLSFYNDSGASIGIGATLTVTDIELFKNGDTGPRATDSGYAILGDTGNFGNRVGFKGISVQIFNTADDTGFYDQGSHYWVAVDGVTVDARTVRFFPAVFEVDVPVANITQVASDTGAASHLAQFSDEYDTGRIAAEASATLDTGAINQAVWQEDAGRTITYLSDTGINNRLDVIRSDTDTGIQGGVHVVSISDTGINNRLSVIASDTDTGIQPPTVAQIVDGIWDEADTGHSDTGTFGRLRATLTKISAGVNVTSFSDTGIEGRLSIIASDTDTGLKTIPTTIQSKTDSLTFTVAGQVDANIQYVNDTQIQGTGDTGTPDTWRPA